MADVIMLFPKTGADLKSVTWDLPLSVLSAASVVAKDFSVKIIDQRVEKNWRDILRYEMTKKPLCVGVSSMTGPQINFGREMISYVKELSPETTIVWGGVHSNLLPQQTVMDPLIDIVVYGEGELPFYELVKTLADKKPLSQVKSIVYKDGNKNVITNEQMPIPNLDDLPELPYELLNIDPYVHTKVSQLPGFSRALPFITSRGCPFRCSFCCNPILTHRAWRAMSSEVAFERVKSVVKKYDLNAIFFHDENFLGKPSRVKHLAEQFNSIGLKWYIQARMDQLGHSDLPFLADNGLIQVQPGIETGSPRINELIKKDESIEEIIKVNKMLAKTSIIPVYNFMTGIPTETIEDIYKTMDLAMRLIDDNPNAQISGFYVFVPYPGSELFDLTVDNGFVPPTELSEWANFSRQHLSTFWIKDKLSAIKNLMYSAKFIDGVRISQAFEKTWIPSSLLRLPTNFYRWRWKKRYLGNTPDIMVLDFIARTILKW